MDSLDPGLMGVYGQGQMYGYDKNSMAAHHQGPTAAHDPKLVSDCNQYQMSVWNKYQMGGLNLNPMGTHHQGPTDTCGPRLLDSWNQDQMGALDLNPMDTHHQSDIDSRQLSYMNPQNTNDADDLMTLFKSSKPIKTRVNQSPHGQKVHDGSYSVMPYRTALPYPTFHENIPVLDTARVLSSKHPKNPRSGSKRRKEGS